MAIKDIGSFNQTLDTGNARAWSRGVDSDGFKFYTEIGGASDAEGGKTFGEFLTDSISKVNSLQHEANLAMEKLASGESQNLHETILAVEKAEIAFKTMNQIRTKVIDAYREIMKMQI
jgi:flagellar hook-basal body complex protein FliE